MVTTPPPIVLTMVSPAASVLVTTEPARAALLEGEDADTGPAAALDGGPAAAFDDGPAAAFDDGRPAEDEAIVLVTTTVVGGLDAVTAVMLTLTGTAVVSVVALCGGTGAGATSLGTVSVTALTDEDTAATAGVVEEGTS